MAESFRAEASCPLCRGLFQDPVSVPCGHSFCRGCIARRWAGLRGGLRCPRCREPAARGSLRPNPELAKVIEVAARLSLRGCGGRDGHGGHDDRYGHDGHGGHDDRYDLYGHDDRNGHGGHNDHDGHGGHDDLYGHDDCVDRHDRHDHNDHDGHNDFYGHDDYYGHDDRVDRHDRHDHDDHDGHDDRVDHRDRHDHDDHDDHDDRYDRYDRDGHDDLYGHDDHVDRHDRHDHEDHDGHDSPNGHDDRIDCGDRNDHHGHDDRYDHYDLYGHEGHDDCDGHKDHYDLYGHDDRYNHNGLNGHDGHGFCGTHQQALKLFCERDCVPICLACREAPEHRDHAVVPIEEATEEYKEKLQAHVQVLKDRRAKLLRLRSSEEGKSLDLLERVAAERQKVASDIEGLRRLVEERERLLLGRLAELDGEVARRREESVGRLSREIASIGEDIAELEGKCRQSAWEFLQDIGSILGRLEEEEEVPKPDEVSLVLGERPMGFPEKNAALKEMLLRFQASLTLDPDTAHPSLALSADGKSVRCEAARRALPAHPKRFDASRCVLARQGFSGGRHYWEVAVGAGDAWAIGVAKESVPRKGRLRVRPANGVWAVGRCGGRYRALAAPSVPLRPLPAAVGVYVDYEAGRVAFVEAGGGAPLFAHAPAAFAGERLLPLLALGRRCRFALRP